MDYLVFVLGAVIFMTAVIVTHHVLMLHGKGTDGNDPIAEGFARYTKWKSEWLVGRTSEQYIPSSPTREATTDVTVPPFDPRHPHCLSWLRDQWERCVIEKKLVPSGNIRARNDFFMEYLRQSLDRLVTSSAMTKSAADRRFAELQQSLEESATPYRAM